MTPWAHAGAVEVEMIFIEDDVVGRQATDVKDRPIGRITAYYNYPTDLEAPWGIAAATRGKVFKRSTHLVDLCDAQIDGDVSSCPTPTRR
jgi:hypothetical protein